MKKEQKKKDKNSKILNRLINNRMMIKIKKHTIDDLIEKLHNKIKKK